MSATTVYNPIGWGNRVALSQFKKDEIAFELRHEDEKIQKTWNSRDRVLPMKTVSIAEALAVAYAAYRINSNQYLKDTRRFSTEENKTQFDNKSLVRYYWQKKLNTSDAQYQPADFEMFEPTEEDYASVQEALKWMKRYVMLGLGELDSFKQDMIKELSQEEVKIASMGRIAYAPEFIARDQHENGLKKTIRVEYRDSKHIEPVGASVETVIEILDKRYSSQWETYNYTAVTTDGNLVSFMNKFEHAVGGRKRIKAKVKSHTKNRLFSADETRLNYVKLFKV